MTLNAYQRAAVRTFAGGAYSWIGGIDDAATLKAAIDATDDLAFQDIMTGLGSPECDSREKAIDVIRNARPNVQRMLDHDVALQAPQMAA